MTPGRTTEPQNVNLIASRLAALGLTPLLDGSALLSGVFRRASPRLPYPKILGVSDPLIQVQSIEPKTYRKNMFEFVGY